MIRWLCLALLVLWPPDPGPAPVLRRPDRFRLWNSDVSQGDPYGPGAAARERVVVTAKQMVRLLAGMVYGLSGGRLLVGSSLSALARKPG